MSHAVRILSVLCALVSVSACATVIGVDGDHREVEDVGAGGGQNDSGASGSAGSAAASSASCAELGRACVSAPPAGWSGPIALFSGEQLPACGGEYPTTVLQTPLHAELELGTASCSCSCEPDPLSCPDASLQEHGAVSSCPVGAQFALLPPSTCKSFSLVQDAKLTLEDGVPDAGPCIAHTTANIPEPSFRISARVCAPEAADGCSGSDVCVPPPPSGGALCVYRDGDHDCPSGHEKSLFFGGFDDQRTCTPCTCGAPSGACAGSVTLYSDSSCATKVGSGAMDACLGPFESVRSARYTASASAVSCPPSSGAVYGAVVTEHPVTFCCLP